MSGVAPHSISDTRVSAATGKTRAEWYALLDAENAATWTHAEIAAWLHKTHRVDPWWAQGITVGYEQARGMRLPGQQPDGRFAAGSSKTLDGDPQAVLERVITVFTDHLGSEPVSVSRAAKHPSARWSCADGTGVQVTVSPATVLTSRAAATRLKLAAHDQLAAAKEELAGLLSRVEQAGH